MDALVCQQIALPRQLQHRGALETNLVQAPARSQSSCSSLITKERSRTAPVPRVFETARGGRRIIVSQTTAAYSSLNLPTTTDREAAPSSLKLNFLWLNKDDHDHPETSSDSSEIIMDMSPGSHDINYPFSFVADHTTAAFPGAKNWEENMEQQNSEQTLNCSGTEELQLEYTKDSFSKFLERVPVEQLKDAAKMCYLSNLAYVTADIKPDELYKFHKLSFVTSSLALKAAAAGSEQSVSVSAARKKSEAAVLEEERRFRASFESPETARALAAAASYLQSNPNGGGRGVDEAAAATVASAYIRRGVESQLSPASTSSTIMVPKAERGGDQQPEANARSCSSPCEWFVCDEKETATRIFAIQGSESLASWRTNLLFQPVHFEDPSTEVMVHHGVYEAAKSMYEQMLPLVQQHIDAQGAARARFRFTGHSLGGSLAVLLSLMFRFRGVVPASALHDPVYTFGAPQMMCGGDSLLQSLGLKQNHVQSVVISGDLVPRIFSCDFPDQIVAILKRVSQRFRNHSCLLRQRQMYLPMGEMLILQPDAQQAPGHPLLPSGSGLYAVRQPRRLDSQFNPFQAGPLPQCAADQVKLAERAFLNKPHPLEIMSNPSSYGSEGSISRDHDPRSYAKAVNHVLRQEIQQWRQAKKEFDKLNTFVPLFPASGDMQSRLLLRRNAVLSLGLTSVDTATHAPTAAAIAGIGTTNLQGLRTPAQQIALGQTPSLAPLTTLVLGSQKDRSSRHSRLVASRHVH